MSVESYQIEELDETTRSYLKAVAQHHGDGLPGIFVPGSGWLLPMLGVIVGSVVIALGLTAFGPDNDPKRLAFLQAAILLVGGWFVFAGLRTFMDGGGAGQFIYADPLYLWEVSGRSVKVHRLANMTEARGTHNIENGGYQNTALEIDRTSGSKIQVTLSNQGQAERLVIFLNVIANMNRQAEESGSEIRALPPVVRGAVARDMVLAQGDLPDDYEPPLVVDSIPEPRREGWPVGGWLIPGFLMTAACAAAIALLVPMNTKARDDSLYEAVKNSRPPELRFYLIDPRNQLHRDDVQKRLEQLYDLAFAAFKQQPGRPKELVDGIAVVIDSLKKAAQPVVTIGFVDELGPCAVPVNDRKAVLEQLSNRLADVLGPDLIAFAEPVGEMKPMVRIRCVKDGAGLKWRTVFEPPDAGDAIYEATSPNVPTSVFAWQQTIEKVFGVSPVTPPVAGAAAPVMPQPQPQPQPARPFQPRSLDEVLRELQKKGQAK